MKDEIKEEKKDEKLERKKLKRRERAEKRQHKHMGISLRWFVTFLIIVLCAGIMLVYSLMSSRLYVQRYQEQLEKNVMAQAEYLKNNLLENHMTLDDPQDLNLRIEGVATTFYGRVLVINREYRVIKDTYGNHENAQIVNPDIMAVMRGQASEKISKKDGYLEYITAVKQEQDVQGVLVIQASTDSLKVIERRVERRNWLSFALIMAICIGAAWAIGNASSRGIKRINQQMEIAGEGQLETQIPVRGFKEFKQLTERYNATISKLMVIDSTRQEFVSNVSHELKTPLTSMKVLADSINSMPDEPKELYQEFMEDITNEIERETKIINDLLSLVKMDKSAAGLNVSSVNINELLEQILKRLQPIADKQKVELVLESFRPVTAEVDEVKITLAITNLVENAIKYNRNDGEGWVHVSLNADHQYFYLKVEDSGIGIPEESLEHIYERFYRVDKSHSREIGGTGLGLSIVKNIILMHHGTIKLYSEEGMGTTFTFRIPLNYVESNDEDKNEN